MAEPADINVDELRRRARRRLVGAIVLALGAAVIVPMLLESDPKPLGDDVTVKIPPVDDGKFVNRLNEPQGKSEPKTEAKTETKVETKTEAIKSDGTVASAKDARKDASPPPESAPSKSIAEAEKAVISPTRAPKYDTAIPSEKVATVAPSPAPTPSPPVAAQPATPSPPQVESKPATAAPPAESKAVVSTPPSPPVQSIREGFAVQLAAYSDDKGANALANRLKRSGYPAYTEPLKTSRGTLWRVRVGPYPSRDAATGVRDKLKAEGQSGIVASAK